MTLPTNDGFTNCELSLEELEAIAAGLIPRFLGPPILHGGPYHPPHHLPPHYYPGGGPNAAGLQVHY